VNSSLASYEAKSSLISVSDKACRVSGYKATSAQLGAQPRFSAKLRVKHPSVLKAKLRSQLKKLLAARLELKHLLGANSEVTSLHNRALLNSAKAPSAHIASPRSEAMTSAKLRLTKACKAKYRSKPKTFQPNRANLQPPRVSMLDRLGPTNTNLREFLSHAEVQL